MRRRLPLALSLPAVALVFGVTALPAAAANAVPTTPVPGPASPGQPPVSAPPSPQSTAHAVGDAAAAVGDLQVLPGLLDTGTILPGFSDTLPKQPLLEGGLGLSSSQVNSESFLSYERSIAESSPIGGGVAGNAPSLPGSLRQTALPDNPTASTGGLNLPQNPLLNVGLLNGSAHARYSPTLGPCVQGPISDAKTSLVDLSVGNLPNPVGAGPLAGVLSATGLNALSPKAKDAVNTSAASGGPNPATLLAPLLAQGTKAAGGSDFALLSAPDTIHSQSTVQLVPLPKSENKAVQSISRFQLADLTLFKNVPLLQSEIKVASQPTLTVTSTGDRKTSTVDYKAPALEVHLPGQPPFIVDARHPFSAPMIGLPLPNLIPQNIQDQFKNMFGMSVDQFKNTPVVGKPAQFLKDALAGNGLTIDLALLKISIGKLDQTGIQMVKGRNGAPFDGFQLGATASMFHLDLLPTQALKLKDGPSAVASLDFGKQVARAYTPTGGVHCGVITPAKPAPPAPKPQASPKQPLAYTDAAYQAVPLFWTGTGLLLAGAVLLAALPRRRRAK